ncbi:MAG: polysaccharide deacetylase family protein [Propylenella sp.]
MTGADPGGEAARDRFVALLDQAAAKTRRISFWWRDDDAVTTTPDLEKLLALARRHALPLALAVIPGDATDALVATLAAEPRVFVLQHGWRHQNHAPPHEKKMELGDHRPLAAVLEELGEGFARLGRMFPERFLPVLVPPWNRISRSVRNARHEIGLAGLSTFGPAPAEPHLVNTHLDIIDWQARGPLPRAEAYARLCEEVERRLRDDPEPLGVLTHHLVHQEPSRRFLEELFSLTARHKAAAWPSIPELFDLPATRVHFPR